MINKIRVQPKKNNPKLVSGWLYIIENSWNVQSADLSATELGVTIRFTATYNEVIPSAFLPTAYDIDMKVNAMGVKLPANIIPPSNTKPSNSAEQPKPPVPNHRNN